MNSFLVKKTILLSCLTSSLGCRPLFTKPLNISILGATGRVGYTTAQLLAHSNVAAQIRLWGRNTSRCQGIAEDIREGIYNTSKTKVESVDTIKAVSESDIVIITAGEAAAPDQPREELLAANMKMIACFIRHLQSLPYRNDDSLLVIVTNPVDDLTWYTIQMCKKYGYLHNPEQQVIGTGTLLDQKRTCLLSGNDKLEFMGEHGPCGFIVWGDEYDKYTPEQRNDLECKVKARGYDILALKGSTECGIAQCLLEICCATQDGSILPLSIWDTLNKAIVSRPVQLSNNRVTVRPLSLNVDEAAKLTACLEKRAKMAEQMS